MVLGGVGGVCFGKESIGDARDTSGQDLEF